MFATNFGCFCKINYFWLTYVQLLAHTNSEEYLNLARKTNILGQENRDI